MPNENGRVFTDALSEDSAKAISDYSASSASRGADKARDVAGVVVVASLLERIAIALEKILALAQGEIDSGETDRKTPLGRRDYTGVNEDDKPHPFTGEVYDGPPQPASAVEVLAASEGLTVDQLIDRERAKSGVPSQIQKGEPIYKDNQYKEFLKRQEEREKAAHETKPPVGSVNPSPVRRLSAEELDDLEKEDRESYLEEKAAREAQEQEPAATETATPPASASRPAADAPLQSLKDMEEKIRDRRDAKMDGEDTSFTEKEAEERKEERKAKTGTPSKERQDKYTAGPAAPVYPTSTGEPPVSKTAKDDSKKDGK